MAKSKTITVTPNVNYCLKVLKKAADALPPGDQKKEAKDALNYLVDTSKGVAQLRRGADCNWARIIPPHMLVKTHKYYKPKP
ncbi:MAG: hypothetical protein KAT17_04975 [Candidatus Aminicenantes bacterium]|nr:hypothetical protein [Candidatus Aminicenantes bacterium]